MRYHNTADRVAPSLRYPGIFRDQVREAALIAMRSLPLSTPDSQLMRDMRREDGPYQFRAMDRLLDLLAQVPDECEALAFIEGLRGAVVARRRRNDVRDLRISALAETEAQGHADVAVERLIYATSPDLALVQDAIGAVGKHKRGIERLLDDLFGKRYQLAHGGK